MSGARAPDEAGVIDAILAASQGSGAYRPRLGAGDDAAVLAGGEVVTTDVMVEGVHFDARSSAADLGWKLVAVNASDVGAMGCRPTWALLTLSLPRPVAPAWLEGFSAGLGEALRRFGVALVGGDTTRSPGPVVVSLTLAGEGPRAVLRSGARPGDRIWVTGALGEAAAGFYGALPGAPPPAEGLAWLRRPEPPVALGAALGASGRVTAMMDLSDGLARDLARLCAASRVGAVVDPDRLPRGPSLAGVADPVPFQVAFGDDYQLLFTAPPGSSAGIRALAAAHGARLSEIGEVIEGAGAALIGRPWPHALFEHFAEDRQDGLPGLP